MKNLTYILFFLLLLGSCGPSKRKQSEDASEALSSDPAIKGSISKENKLEADKDPAEQTSLKLVPYPVKLKKGLSFNFNVLQGFEVKVAFEGMERLRFMTWSPDGRLFATDMHDLTDNHIGKVYIFDGYRPREGRFRRKYTYLENLHNPNQVAFYEENGKSYLYVATTDKLVRYEYHPKDTLPKSEPEILDTFPSYGLSYKYGGWHLTRSIAFHNNKLYVSVGSSCNACIEKEWMRATILEMNPDGTDAHIYAEGLRNAVGMKWIKDDLFVTAMGQDQFGPDKPEDLFLNVKPGKHYGWPYYYESGNKIYADDSFATEEVKQRILAPPLAYAELGAHSAPLGFDYLENFNDLDLNNYFLVALHGSSIISIGHGYAIVRVKKGHKVEPVITGFLQGKQRFARPCDILQNDANSFFFTDDLNGVLYLVRKTEQ